jgi:hypothetical protein
MRIGPQRLEAAQSLSSRIWVDQRGPAAAVERLPRSFGLGEEVGDGVDRGGVMAEPAMAPFNLDVLCQRAGASMHPRQAQTPSVRLKIAVVGTGGGSASAAPKSPLRSSARLPLAIS